MRRKSSITKSRAIVLLVKAGRGKEASRLQRWRSKLDTDSGWDGWFRVEYPHLIPIVWGKP